MQRILGIRTVDNFVDSQPNMWMENYTIVKHTPHPRAASSVKGVFNRKTGEWGFTARIDPNEHGKWVVYGVRGRR